MRPIRLTMSAFGSYAEEEVIDFSKVEQGIFLITGDTGSGKTTIFDGIVYALYDRTSGGVRDGNMMRSAYADLRTPTFVELVFACRGEHFRIVRNPDYERESLRKDKDGNPKKTQEKSKVELYLPDGSLFHGNKKQVNQKIEELLGMDARQFMQMAMIAQGDFLKLIHAKSEERREIFSKLFDTGIYGKVQEELRRQEKECFVRVKEKENACLEQIGRIICPEEDAKLLSDLKNALDVEAAITLLDRLGAAGKQEEEILGKQRKELEEEISLVKKAEELLEQVQTTGEKLRKYHDWLSDNLPKEKLYKEKEAQAACALEKKSEEQRLFESAFSRKLEEFQKKSRELLEERATLNGLKKLWDGMTYRQSVQKERALAWKESNALYQKNRMLYEEMYETFLLAQAGILAENLKDGEPCPVCGSTSHPDRAILSESAPDQERVKTARTEVQREEKNREKSQAAFQEAVKEYQSCLGSLNQEGKRLFGDIFDADSDIWRQNSLDAVKKSEADFYDCERAHKVYQKQGEEKRRALEKELEICKKEELQSKHALENFIRQTERVQGEKQALEAQLSGLTAAWKEKNSAFGELTPELLKEQLQSSRERLADLKVRAEAAEKSFRECYVRNHSNEKTGEVLREYQKEYLNLKEEYALIRHLSQTAGGSLAGSARLDFESYVQRQYFEKIIQKANQRLLQMSSGQFLLKSRKLEDLKKVGKVGLDLDIYSLVTESDRDIKTLSGGESFMAALCMALGMADVIQDSSGAIRLDTMFIDEGFGSLDERAREQAIQVLYRLAGENRLIGIISHVTELKEQIEPKLVVKKGKRGSHVTWQSG